MAARQEIAAGHNVSVVTMRSIFPQILRIKELRGGAILTIDILVNNAGRHPAGACPNDDTRVASIWNLKVFDTSNMTRAFYRQ